LHLTLALQAGYQTGEKPVTAELVETVLSRQLGDLKPTLARHGYRLKDMTEQFDAKAAGIRAMSATSSNRSARPRFGSACWHQACQYEPSFAVSVSRRPWNASRRRRLQAYSQIV
jgi:predicted solute-binding protein